MTIIYRIENGGMLHNMTFEKNAKLIKQMEQKNFTEIFYYLDIDLHFLTREEYKNKNIGYIIDDETGNRYFKEKFKFGR